MLAGKGNDARMLSYQACNKYGKPDEGGRDMKFEWKKQEKHLYLPDEKPSLITISPQKFIVIGGKGNPNEGEFAERVGVLFSLAYAIRMMPKQGYVPEGYFEYTVYPLEGVWDLSDFGKQSGSLDKDELVYRIMIRQPDFVLADVFERAMDKVRRKTGYPMLKDVSFETLEDGLCVQMMHVGSYDGESRSFALMKRFIGENQLRLVTLQHREIYLQDARKTEKENLKTVLRYRVER